MTVPLLGSMGASKSLAQASSMPQIAAAFSGWMTTIYLVRVSQNVVDDGFICEKTEQVPFQGVVQPLSPKLIALKPEGERAWSWLQIHLPSTSPLKLNVNDKIIYNSKKFKIMGNNDYTLDGYVEFHAVEDFQ